MAHPPESEALPWPQKVASVVKFVRSARGRWLQAEWFVSADDPETAWEAAASAREHGALSDADDLEAITLTLEAEQANCERHGSAHQAREPLQLAFPWREP